MLALVAPHRDALAARRGTGLPHVRESQPSRENLIELDCLRGIAILLVFFHHADGMLTPKLGAGGQEMSALRAFVGGGHSGVSLFFVLSAFCLSLPIVRSGGAKRFTATGFFRRRALRILPMYWAVVMVGALIAGTELSAAAPYLVFAHSLPDVVAPIPGFSDVWWSLATEIQFYLLLPLLPFALASRRSRWIELALLSAYLASYVCYVSGDFPLGAVKYELALSHSVYGRGPLFLLGIGAAWIFARFGPALSSWFRARPALRLGASDAMLAACVFALGSLLSWITRIGYYSTEAPPKVLWHIAEGLGWSTIVLMVLLLPLVTKGLFVNPVLATIGRWSYSIYLLHLVILRSVVLPLREAGSPRFRSWDLETGLVILGATAMCIGMSAMTYQLIEKPFLRRKDRTRGRVRVPILSREPA